MERGLEILRRILLVANYGLLVPIGLVGIATFTKGVAGLLGYVEPPPDIFDAVVICTGFASFGAAYGLHKLINWILLPSEPSEDGWDNEPPEDRWGPPKDGWGPPKSGWGNESPED